MVQKLLSIICLMIFVCFHVAFHTHICSDADIVNTLQWFWKLPSNTLIITLQKQLSSQYYALMQDSKGSSICFIQKCLFMLRCYHEIRKKTIIVVMHLVSFLWTFTFLQRVDMSATLFFCSFSSEDLYNVIMLIMLENVLLFGFGIFKAFVKSISKPTTQKMLSKAKVMWKFLICCLSVSKYYVLLLFYNMFLTFCLLRNVSEVLSQLTLSTSGRSLLITARCTSETFLHMCCPATLEVLSQLAMLTS